MPAQSTPFRLRQLASDTHPRYVVADSRRPPECYWSGSSWTANLGEAQLYSDSQRASRTLQTLSIRHLRRQQPKRLFLLTLVVRAHADETVSRTDLEKFLQDALVVSVNHQKHGMGPTPNSLVEVLVPVIHLEEGR